MNSQDQITINRDEATQLYIARCLYCDEVVAAGKDRRVANSAESNTSMTLEELALGISPTPAALLLLMSALLDIGRHS